MNQINKKNEIEFYYLSILLIKILENKMILKKRN